MSNLMQGILSQVGGQAIDSLTGSLGAEKSQVQSAVTMAVPLLMKALAKNSQTEEGAQALSNALEKDHQGSILENVADLLGSEQTAGIGSGILKHILGDKLAPAAQMISSASGLSQDNVMNLISRLAPMVMGFIGKHKKEQGLDVSSLASMLTGASQEADSEAPDAMGALGKLLDADGDGNYTDDLLKMGSSVLGSFLK